MKSDFLIAITQLSAEKNLPKEVVLAAVESALVSAYRKDDFAASRNISVKIDPETGKVTVLAEKTVVEEVEDYRREMTLEEARRDDPDAEIGDELLKKLSGEKFGRIAAQAAKQNIVQRVRDAEREIIYGEFKDPPKKDGKQRFLFCMTKTGWRSWNFRDN